MHPFAPSTLRVCGLVLILALAGPADAVGTQDKARAKAFFERGKAAFELGKFTEALEAYEKAYEVAPLPGFLFNIGQCHRNLGNRENAIFSFRLYLKKAPRAQNRLAVEQLLEKLEAELARIRAEEKREREKQQEAARLRREAERQREINKRLAQQLLAPTSRPAARKRPAAPPPIHKRWWFWTGLSVLVVGGAAVGTYFALRPREAEAPPSGFPVVLDFSRIP